MMNVGRLGTFPKGGIKAPVRVASAGPLTLAGEQTVDTVNLVVGDRVLVKDQVNPVENGIYSVSAGPWTRATDFNEAKDVVSGVLVLDSKRQNLYSATFTGEWSAGTTPLVVVTVVGEVADPGSLVGDTVIFENEEGDQFIFPIDHLTENRTVTLPDADVTIPSGTILTAEGGVDRLKGTNGNAVVQVGESSNHDQRIEVSRAGAGTNIVIEAAGAASNVHTTVKSKGSSADIVLETSRMVILSSNSGVQLRHAANGYGYNISAATSSAIRTITLPNSNVTIPGGTLAGLDGAQTFTGVKTFTGVIETLSAVTGSSMTPNLSVATGFKLTTTANATVTIPSPTASVLRSFTVIVAYGGAHTLTWAGATIKWEGGVPTPTSANGKVDIFTFVQDGANTYGFVSGQDL